MIIDGKVVGKPIIEYYGTQAQIEALTDIRLGMLAYATDINKIGYYSGSIWTWIDPVGGGAAAGTTGDIQYNNAGEFAADTGKFAYDPLGDPFGTQGTLKVASIRSPSTNDYNPALRLGGDSKSTGHGNDIHLLGGDTTDAIAGGHVYIKSGKGGVGGDPSRIFIQSSDQDTTYQLILSTDLLTTTDRTVSFPNKDGTVAYLSDLISSGIDTNAIHTNQSNEISTLTEKITLTSNDLFVIEDSGASGAKKKVKFSNITASGILHANIANEFSGITEKTTFSGADWFLIEDSEASWAKKKIKKANLGTGMSEDFSIWSPHSPPLSPGADDDEFLTIIPSGVPSGWTNFDPGAVQLCSVSEQGLTLFQTSHTGDKISGIYKAIPAGDFTITSQFGLSTGYLNYIGGGIVLYENAGDPTKRIYTWGWNSDAGAKLQIRINLFTTYLLYSTTVFTLSNVQITDAIFRIRRNSTTYHFEYSTNGIGFIRLYTGTLAFVPTHYGLYVDNNGTGVDGILRVPYFRYVNSDLGITGLASGDRIGMHRH